MYKHCHISLQKGLENWLLSKNTFHWYEKSHKIGFLDKPDNQRLTK